MDPGPFDYLAPIVLLLSQRVVPSRPPTILCCTQLSDSS
jgi:hypothetical protein